MSQGVQTGARTGFPTVSVIIPAYNSSTTIAETLRSIFRQSRHDFEIVVVDDGSADREALEAAVAPWRDSVHLLLMQPNRGAGAARNRALLHAKGEYVAFLDSDDTWMPGFLEAQLGYLERHPDCDMVWSDGWISGESGHAGRRERAVRPAAVYRQRRDESRAPGAVVGVVVARHRDQPPGRVGQVGAEGRVGGAAARHLDGAA